MYSFFRNAYSHGTMIGKMRKTLHGSVDPRSVVIDGAANEIAGPFKRHNDNTLDTLQRCNAVFYSIFDIGLDDHGRNGLKILVQLGGYVDAVVHPFAQA